MSAANRHRYQQPTAAWSSSTDTAVLCDSAVPTTVSM